MSFSNKIIGGATGAILLATTMTISLPEPAHADDAGAFVGGVMAARIGQNMRSRTQAEQQQAQAAQDQAYYQQQQAQQVQQAPPPAAEPTVEERLAKLDKLAEGGYITPEDYKKKKQAILDEI